MRKIFLDSADVGYCEKVLSVGMFYKEEVLGITTNPKAFSKINCFNLSEWRDATKNLCGLISDFRGDNQGIVYVQIPSSNASYYEVMDYVKEIKKWTDGKTSIGLKIPHFWRFLHFAHDLGNSINLNVTGVTDALTAVRALTANVKYVSFLTGRMDENSLNSLSHLKFLGTFQPMNRIITGSMRTVEGLAEAVAYGTVPTIGAKLLDLLFDEKGYIEFKNAIKTAEAADYLDDFDVPDICTGNIELSQSFFEEMDALGKNVAEAIEIPF